METTCALRVCTTCAGGSLAICDRIIRDAGLTSRVTVLGQECLNRCQKPLAIAIQGSESATYVFDGLDLEKDAPDLVETLLAYLDTPGGWIEDARRCGRLRHRLCARVLPISVKD